VQIYKTDVRDKIEAIMGVRGGGGGGDGGRWRVEVVV
jgi:hypothetical protein